MRNHLLALACFLFAAGFARGQEANEFTDFHNGNMPAIKLWVGHDPGLINRAYLLSEAVLGGHPAAVEYCLAHGADPNLVSPLSEYEMENVSAENFHSSPLDLAICLAVQRAAPPW